MVLPEGAKKFKKGTHYTRYFRRRSRIINNATIQRSNKAHLSFVEMGLKYMFKAMHVLKCLDKLEPDYGGNWN